LSRGDGGGDPFKLQKEQGVQQKQFSNGRNQTGRKSKDQAGNGIVHSTVWGKLVPFKKRRQVTVVQTAIGPKLYGEISASLVTGLRKRHWTRVVTKPRGVWGVDQCSKKKI